MNILYIEDDLEIGSWVKKELLQKGYYVEWIHRGCHYKIAKGGSFPSRHFYQTADRRFSGCPASCRSISVGIHGMD
ncbi:hypothetical protein [Bacillus sp. V2I10]|uniref:hypothetical protein n=1 Tax=Bacillus sp. V2I10 TaxID=3042276 RepID=UPI002786A59C|nr:hypothetical protein [Bacillus sp. V2I10]MDQ0860609.1 hypothetical protein [Bacillus sp. V2I10]